MRYSLRWLLVAMAYIALVVGAVVSRTELLADAVWLVSVLAILYATVSAFVSTGSKRAQAFGFALLSGVSIVALYLIPDRLPANRLFSALGYRISSGVQTGGSIYVTETYTDPRRPGQLRQRRLYVQDSEAIVSTVNAVGAMIAGFVGAGIGALAYRHSAVKE